jgi:hypothetical protein
MADSQAPHKNFDVEQPLSAPSGSFDLGGRTWRVRNKDDVSIGLGNLINDDKIEVGKFFKAFIYPDDVKDFMTLIEDPEGALTKRRLTPIMNFVSELVMGRPTTPAADSSPGRKKTGRKSAAGSSSRATPRSKSA